VAELNEAVASMPVGTGIKGSQFHRFRRAPPAR
jgi:hypothetical protein